jgi:hypothetical protein
MPFPQLFDKNEIFFSLVFMVLIFLAIRLPKRFPLSISILLITYGAFIGNILDTLLATQPLDTFDVFDSKHYELFDLFIFFGYGFYYYILIYIYDRLSIRGFQNVHFVIFSSAVSSILELIMVSFNIFTYKGWKIYYSYTAYLFVIWSMVLFYRFIVSKFQPTKNL